jgi:integrase
MPWVRKLPSGLWAATVRLPGKDRKITESFELKGQANEWANNQVAALAKGNWIDPRLGEITVEELWDRSRDGRLLELASRKRDDSHYRCHVQPYWHRWAIAAILQPDVQTWVVKMQKAGVGSATITGSLKVLRGLLEQGVAGRLISFNPARGVKVPRSAPADPRILEVWEDQVVLDAFTERHGDRCDGRLFVELLMETGCRWEEAAALSRPAVDMTRKRVKIADVMERDGTIRSYAKSEAGNRPVPIGEAFWPRFRDHVMTVPAGGLVFTSAQGLPLQYRRWLDRIWGRAFIVVTERGGRNGQHILATRPLLDGEQPTPHGLRHTYGTRLAEQGMPQHEIMALMGHSDPRASQRYMHAGEARFDRARAALDAARKASGSHAAHGDQQQMTKLPRQMVKKAT